MSEKKKALPAGKAQITFRLPEELIEQVKIKAQAEGFSINAYILLLINKEINVHQ